VIPEETTSFALLSNFFLVRDPAIPLVIIHRQNSCLLLPLLLLLLLLLPPMMLLQMFDFPAGLAKRSSLSNTHHHAGDTGEPQRPTDSDMV